MSDRSKIRKRSEEDTAEAKKTRKSNSETMAENTVKPITDEARNMLADLHIITIENTIEESMDRRMEQWLSSKKYQESQESLVDRFAAKCSTLIESATKKIDAKIEKIEDTTISHDKRLTELEKMADDFDQSKRSNNIVIRGINAIGEPKVNLVNTITSGLGIHITERDVKYLIKLAMKNEREDTISIKVAFYEQRLRDEIYTNRLKLMWPLGFMLTRYFTVW